MRTWGGGLRFGVTFFFFSLLFFPPLPLNCPLPFIPFPFLRSCLPMIVQLCVCGFPFNTHALFFFAFLFFIIIIIVYSCSYSSRSAQGWAAAMHVGKVDEEGVSGDMCVCVCRRVIFAFSSKL
uniref:Uncharacterized protein n=1 Tax=Trypanosoma congolense (strain IL3000) TaxID=1068625 RepID=G0URD6_TRYCI|nr:hypothetical protein, unlikely [Trypanosoma congolense IL3000]